MGIVLGWQEAKEHPEMTLEQPGNSLLRLPGRRLARRRDGSLPAQLVKEVDAMMVEAYVKRRVAAQDGRRDRGTHG